VVFRLSLFRPGYFYDVKSQGGKEGPYIVPHGPQGFIGEAPLAVSATQANDGGLPLLPKIYGPDYAALREHALKELAHPSALDPKVAPIGLLPPQEHLPHPLSGFCKTATGWPDLHALIGSGARRRASFFADAEGGAVVSRV
jgi:hypothetical protein